MTNVRNRPGLTEWWRDIRWSLAQLRRSPGFTAVAVASLGLGLAGVLLVFTAANAVLWRPLPGVHAPDRLVRLTFGDGPGVWSYPDFDDVRGQVAGLSTSAAFTTGPVTLGGNNIAPREVMAQQVSDGYFSTLGIVPTVGRPLTGGDVDDIAVISERLWDREFHRAPDTVGSSVLIGGRPHQIVGIAPPGLTAITAPVEPDVYYPVGPAQRADREFHSLNVIARLSDDLTLDAVQAEVSAAVAALVRLDAQAYRTQDGRPIEARVLTEQDARVPPGDRLAVGVSDESRRDASSFLGRALRAGS